MKADFAAKAILFSDLDFPILNIIFQVVGISNVGILNTRIKLFYGVQIKGLVAIDQTATKVHNADGADSRIQNLLIFFF